MSARAPRPAATPPHRGGPAAVATAGDAAAQAPATAEVWLMPLADAGDADAATALDRAARRCRRCLDASELARLAAISAAARSREYVLGHALARHALSTAAPLPPAAWRFDTGAGGRPRVAGATQGGFEFNISHTVGLIAVAVTRGVAVGVDVEHTGREVRVASLARRFFAVDEAAALECLPASARRAGFFACWTLKEAYLKARGTGLRLPLGAFAFEPSVAPQPVAEGDERLLPLAASPAPRFAPALDDRAERWRFALIAPAARHLLALALCEPPADATLRLRRITPAALAAAVED